MPAPYMYVTQKLVVTASHHLSSPRLSPEQAHALYGGAALLHGHAYGIKVTMKGTLDAGVGGLVGGDLMEDVVALAVSEQLDTKNLDEISYFTNRPSTVENMAVFIWRNISAIIQPHPFEIVEVKVKASPCSPSSSRCLVSRESTYRGELMEGM